VKLLSTAFLIASSALAQGNGSIEGPVLGMVFDPDTAAVRLLEGIPGTAKVGAVLAPDLATAAVAANRGFAIGVQRNGAPVLVTSAGARPLPAARAGASRVIVSPRGTAAALVFAGRSVEIFTGLPEAAQLRRTLDLEEMPAELALSDDGEVLLSIVRGRRGGDTVFVHRDAGPQVFYRARRVAAVAFVPGTQDALVAESAAVKIVRPDLGEQRAGVDLDSSVSAVAASPDGSRVFIASRAGRVTIHDLRSGASSSVVCACAPRSFAPLRGNSVFRLNDGGDGPLWVLDADAAEPRISFIPAGGESR
jgi:hypothetical protein